MAIIFISTKMKFSLFTFGVLLCLSTQAQNLRILQGFDKIPLNSERYVIEGYINNVGEFYSPKNGTVQDNKYLYIEYSGTNRDSLILGFYDGILFFKKLILKYSISEQGFAKKEYENIKTHIKSTPQKITAVWT